VELAGQVLVSGRASEKLEENMSRFGVLVTLSIALLFAAPGMTQAGQYGTPDEAKALRKQLLP
jgi:hypothetical protein